MLIGVASQVLFPSAKKRRREKSGKSHWIDPNVFCYVVCCMWKKICGIGI